MVQLSLKNIPHVKTICVPNYDYVVSMGLQMNKTEKLVILFLCTSKNS
jgi:hypothetical protein